jgi:hypothetical protein
MYPHNVVTLATLVVYSSTLFSVASANNQGDDKNNQGAGNNAKSANNPGYSKNGKPNFIYILTDDQYVAISYVWYVTG